MGSIFSDSVIKIFNKSDNKLIYNDCGIICELDNGKIITSQWVDDNYEVKVIENGWRVTGNMNVVPSNKLFTPLKNIIFRVILVLTGWQPALAHFIKGKIRKSLILGQRNVPVRFFRKLEIFKHKVSIFTTIELGKGFNVKKLSIGDEFFIRYVPQSRYFQSQELDVSGWTATETDIQQVNKDRKFDFHLEI